MTEPDQLVAADREARRLRGPVGLAIGHEPELTIRDLAGSAQLAERHGLEFAFFSESLATNRDSATALAAFSLATSRVRLGSIQAVRLRSPLVLAQTAATLDELSGGRLVVALGAFTRRHAARHGLAPSPPGETLSEYVETFRLLLRGEPMTFPGNHVEPVTFPGNHVALEQTGLNWRPVRTRIPDWIAANSPGGLAAAARLGDGVLLDGASSPEYTANAVARIRESARAAGRDLRGFRVAQYVNVSLAGTRDAALQCVRPTIAHRFRAEQPGAARIAIGEPHVTPEDLARLVAAYQGCGTEALEAAMPASSVAGLSASGTEADVQARVAEYRAAGVDVPLPWPARGTSIEAVLAAFGRPNEQEVMQ